MYCSRRVKTRMSGCGARSVLEKPPPVQEGGQGDGQEDDLSFDSNVN